MPTCPGCDAERSAADLTRHEDDGMVRVHCPECGRLLGTYNRRARE
ncbi:MAG: hypothetical protein ABEJ42_05265 [Halobacteriaceae archaeon]